MRIRVRGSTVVRVDETGHETPHETLSVLSDIEVLSRASNPKSLRVIAFSDYRSQDIQRLIQFVPTRKPDLILYGGDDIERFKTGTRNLFEEIARKSAFGLCAVAGNDDQKANEYITGERVYRVHNRALIIGPFAVVGIEGAPLFPKGVGERLNIGHLLYPEPLIEHQIKRWGASNAFKDKRLIILSHAPPFGVLDFALRFGARHIGSRPLLAFLKSSASAVLCVCGHVHRFGGQSEKLGTCTIVNAASHDGTDDQGKVAEIRISRGAVVSVKWHYL